MRTAVQIEEWTLRSRAMCKAETELLFRRLSEASTAVKTKDREGSSSSEISARPTRNAMGSYPFKGRQPPNTHPDTRLGARVLFENGATGCYPHMVKKELD
jgi:hypothetical protein